MKIIQRWRRRLSELKPGSIPHPGVLHVCLSACLQSLVMDFNLLTDSEPRSPTLSLSDSGTPQHDPGCKGQDNSGQWTPNLCMMNA